MTKQKADELAGVSVKMELFGLSMSEIELTGKEQFRVSSVDTGIMRRPVIRISGTDDFYAALHQMQALSKVPSGKVIALCERMLDAKLLEWTDHAPLDSEQEDPANPPAESDAAHDVKIAKRTLQQLKEETPAELLDLAVRWMRVGRMVERVEHVRPGEQQIADRDRRLTRTNTKVVDRIRALRRQGVRGKKLSDQQIALKLNDEGIQKRGGRPWNKNDVHSYRTTHKIK